MSRFDPGRENLSPLQVEALSALASNMAKDGAQRAAPMREVFARLGDRWSMLLLLVLRTGCLRSAALRRVVSQLSAEGHISQRMFTLRMRKLEEIGFVSRSVTPSVPPAVGYALTPLGQSLLREVDVLMDWVRRNIDPKS